MVPTDEDFDDMHHALGRPDGPHVEPYRNRYVVGYWSRTALRFEALGWWDRCGTMNQGRDGIYAVNEAGKAALWSWLSERQRAKGVRAWMVYGGGLTPRSVVAKSASAARYRVWLDVSDATNETFREFQRRGVKVSLAPGAQTARAA